MNKNNLHVYDNTLSLSNAKVVTARKNQKLVT